MVSDFYEDPHMNMYVCKALFEYSAYVHFIQYITCYTAFPLYMYNIKHILAVWAEQHLQIQKLDQ